MYMSTTQGANASNYEPVSILHTDNAKPMVNHDYFKGQTDKEIIRDVNKNLKQHSEIPVHAQL